MKTQSEISYDELQALLKKDNTDLMGNEVALTDYLISIYIHNKTEYPYFDLFTAYISGDKEYGINTLLCEMAPYGLDKFWVRHCLRTAEYQLHEYGFFDDNNKFRNLSLYRLITENAYKGSFEVVTLAASYLKLANHENREVDISSLAYCWCMYYNRKDYSVFTIDKALLTFEKKGFVNWKRSFLIIDKLLDQSEKGIRHILTTYINSKGIDFVSELNETGYFQDENINIDFWELESPIYKCFAEEQVAEQVTTLLSRHYYSKTIDYADIRNILHSDHRDLVLYGIGYYDYTIESAEEDLIAAIERMRIRYTAKTQKEKSEHIPLRHGSISESDFEYIFEQNIDYLEISRYADGWSTCLPFVDIFAIYPKESIQKDYLSIIHNAMFPRVSYSDFIGNWYYLIGHIPEFLSQFDIDVDWKKIYDIFNAFLALSLIYRDKAGDECPLLMGGNN